MPYSSGKFVDPEDIITEEHPLVMQLLRELEVILRDWIKEIPK